MTRNTLEYLKNQETSRHNLATENQAKAELQQEYAKLAETIRNNKAINAKEYANIELGYANLSETQRNNIERNAIALMQAIETARHNGVTENISLKELAQTVKRDANNYKQGLYNVLAKLADGGILGKIGITQLGVLGQTELELLLGADGMASGQYNPDWSTGNISNSSSITRSTSKTGSTSRGYTVSNPSDAIRVENKGFYSKQTGQYYDSARERKQAEQNEKPLDTTNSNGPGGNSNENSSTTSQNVERSGSGTSSSTIGPGAGLSKSASTSNSKSAVVYSPGAKESSQTGPGIAFS